VAEARRFSSAEAGALFLREGGALRFAVVQNEPPAQRVGGEPPRLDLPRVAGYVAMTGETIVLPNGGHIDDRTRSVLAVRSPGAGGRRGRHAAARHPAKP
jgi:hypothetical protein